MGRSFMRRLGTVIMIGVVGVWGLNPPTPALAENMMGAFSTDLKGQGVYASMDVNGHAIGSLQDGVILVQAMGLTPMMEEHAYVAWLVNPASGERLNVGSLMPVGAGGAYTTAFKAGMPLTDSNFTMIAITAESMMNMSNMSDGEVVVAGSL